MRKQRAPQKFFYDVVLNYEGDDCLIWPYAKTRGYGVIRIDDQLRYVSRLVAGDPPFAGAKAAHTCGKGQHGCVAKRHIEWKTQKQNKADELIHGTRIFGARNGRVKLTESDVHEIRKLLKTAMRRVDIGDKFGVTREAINEIAWGKNWSWLTTEGENHETHQSSHQ